MIHFKQIFISLVLVTLSFGNSLAQDVYIKNGVAIDGYDVVSYFKDGPQKGKESFKTVYQGTTYLFASAAHLAIFKEDSKRYLPQYGGFCAYAVAKSGDKVSINPKTYEIRDDKLYLFYNAWGTNTLKKWLKDPEEFRQKADANWSSL